MNLNLSYNNFIVLERIMLDIRRIVAANSMVHMELETCAFPEISIEGFLDARGCNVMLVVEFVKDEKTTEQSITATYSRDGTRVGLSRHLVTTRQSMTFQPDQSCPGF
jgi:hypothetical protein